MYVAVIDMIEHDVVDLGGTDEWESCIGKKEEFAVESVQTCRTSIRFVDDVCTVLGITSIDSPSTNVVLEAKGVLGIEAGVPGAERGVLGKHARLVLLERARGKLQLPPSGPFNQDDIVWEKHHNSGRGG